MNQKEMNIKKKSNKKLIILNKHKYEKQKETINPSETVVEDFSNLMILPHLHKHDLNKKTLYDKNSYWICGGYFTEIGCLNTFNCLFKNIDFEFPHYQCHECEFQICYECVQFYTESPQQVKFLHRTYNPTFHMHPVKLDLGSESKSWVCSGMGLPNKCLSVNNGEALIGHKRWRCADWKVQLWYKWIKRKDVEASANNLIVHEHQLFKGKFSNFFNPAENVLCDAGSKSIGIEHDIDSEQKVLRCAPCNFTWCEECFKIVSENQKEEEKATKEFNLMNQSISNLKGDEVVYISMHPHPLVQVIDDNLLWDFVQNGNCKSLTHKSNLSEAKYFKCLKSSCNFQLCALCTSPYVRKVKSLKKGGTWLIF